MLIFKNKIKTLLFFLKPKRIIVVSRAFYGDEWVQISLKSVEKYVSKVLIVTSDKSWNGKLNREDDIESIFSILSKDNPKYNLLKGEWNDQVEQQNDILNYIRKHFSKCTHILFLDTDEVYKEEDIKKMIRYSKSWKTFNKSLRVRMYTYFKSIYYRVAPLEPYAPIALIPIRDYIRFCDVRQVDGCNSVVTDVHMHHFSLVRKNDERVKQKFSNRAKSFKRVENWYEKFYLKFSPEMKNFHPIKGNENQWASLEKVNSIDLPVGVEDSYKRW